MIFMHNNSITDIYSVEDLKQFSNNNLFDIVV